MAANVLRGKRIVVTRPSQRAQAWLDAFEQAGAEVIACPVIELTAVAGTARDAAIATLTVAAQESGSWLAFTSVPAVEQSTALLDASGLLADVVRGCRIASVGPLSTEALTASGWRVDLEPDASNATALARQILVREPTPNVLHPTSNRGRVELCRTITAAGGQCTQVVVYENQPRTGLSDAERAGLSGASDLLAFASPSAVEAYMALTAGAASMTTPVLAVGETTAAAARGAGFVAVHVSSGPRPEQVTDAACRAFQ